MTRMLSDILGDESSEHTFAPTVAAILKNYCPSDKVDPWAATEQPPATAIEHAEPEPGLQFPEEVPAKVAALVRTLLSRHTETRCRDAHTALHSLASAVQFPLPVETIATRESLLQATTLLGREAEMSKLLALLKNAQSGQGTSLLIGGESGVGKSRLLFELRTLALVSGLWVVEGQSVSEGGSYYQELLPLLRMLCIRTDINAAEASILKPFLPEISSLLERSVVDPPQVSLQETQVRLIATLLGLLAKPKKPLLVILEDLHWARGESLALLAAMMPTLVCLPVLFIGTFRSDEKPELPKQLFCTEVLPLHRLSREDIGQLSASMLGAVGATPTLVRYLEQQTEGNVFFLIEVVRALAENAGELRRIGEGELPESVLTLGIERIVEQRIERVRPSFRALLEFAAIAGRKLDLQYPEAAPPYGRRSHRSDLCRC